MKIKKNYIVWGSIGLGIIISGVLLYRKFGRKIKAKIEKATLSPNQISKNITLAEAIYSQEAQARGIDNTPNEQQKDNMRELALNVVEPVFDKFGKVEITSFFRCPALNSAIGGAINSEHQALGDSAAIDLDADGYLNVTNLDIFNYIRENLNFRQLIWEKGNDNQPDWIHVSFKPSDNKKQILRTRIINGVLKYQEWKTS